MTGHLHVEVQLAARGGRLGRGGSNWLRGRRARQPGQLRVGAAGVVNHVLPMRAQPLELALARQLARLPERRPEPQQAHRVAPLSPWRYVPAPGCRSAAI